MPSNLRALSPIRHQLAMIMYDGWNSPTKELDDKYLSLYYAAEESGDSSCIFEIYHLAVENRNIALKDACFSSLVNLINIGIKQSWSKARK